MVDSPLYRFRSPLLVSLCLVLAIPIAAYAQDVRETMVANQSAESLRILDLSGCEYCIPYDQGLELRLYPLSGSSTLIAADGQVIDTVLPGTWYLAGFGASPDVNNSGFSVFMGGLSLLPEPSSDDYRKGQGLFRGSDTGTLTLIAEAWGGLDETVNPAIDGDATPEPVYGTAMPGGDTLCHFEPMPAINNNGQVAFGFNSDMTGGADIDSGDCEDLISDEAGIAERKGVARWTSPSTIITYVQSGNTETLGSPFRASPATYTITKTGFTHMGGRVFNDQGYAVADVLLDNDFTDNEVTATAADEDPDLNGSGRTYYDDRNALLFLKGSSDYELIAATGPPGSSIFQEVEAPVMNDVGQVVFKGVAGTVPYSGSGCGYNDWCNETSASLVLWSEADGMEILVDTDSDGASVNTTYPSNPPGSTSIFQGIGPHFSINNAGQIAFSAGLLVWDSSSSSWEESGDQDDDYGVVMLRQPNGTLVEIARTTEADEDDTSGTFNSSAGGFDFDMIGDSVTVTEDGAVFFTAETNDGRDNPCTTGIVETNYFTDGDEYSAVIRWSPANGNQVFLEEGGFYNGMRIMMINLPQPHLRDQTDDSGRMFVRMVLDSDNDCVVDDEDDDTLGVGVAGGPLAPTALPAEIPTLNFTGMLLFGLLLAAAALLMLRIAS